MMLSLGSCIKIVIMVADSAYDMTICEIILSVLSLFLIVMNK